MVDAIIINARFKKTSKQQIVPNTLGLRETIGADLIKRIPIDRNNILIVQQEVYNQNAPFGFELFKNKVLYGRYAGNGVLVGKDNRDRMIAPIENKNEKITIKYYSVSN